MSTIDVNSVLAQIRAFGTQVQAPANNAKAAANPASEATGQTQGFGSMVGKAMDEVNNTQQQASALQNKFELGDPSVDLSSVMLATSKAQLEFRAMVEVRNRLVTAYQDIMNMPI